MSLLSDIRTFLLGNSGAGTVASLVDDRVYPDRADQGSAAPYIVVTNPSSEQDQALDGPVGGGNHNVVIECKAPVKVNAESVEAAVKTRMNSCVGTVGSSTVLASFLRDRSGEFEEFADGSESGQFVRRLEYEIQL